MVTPFSSFRFIALSTLLLAAAVRLAGSEEAPERIPPPDLAEVHRVAALLPREPCGVGRPITDREAWSIAAQQPYFQAQLREASRFLLEPTPALTEELFNEVVTSGTRVTYERLYRLRTTRLVAFTLAECVEDRGRYLPAIENELAAILAEKSWSVPAVVLLNAPFGGADRSIDLGSASRAWTLATVDYWLGDKLKPATRTRLRAEMRRRIFDYYCESIQSGNPHWSWMTSANNWNPVCNSGVVGAALALLPDPEDRALFVVGAHQYLGYYLRGFPADGYDAEGLGYWNYGFGSYLCLAETVYQQTRGGLNWFSGAELRQIALFPRHFGITDGVFPAFGDSGVVKLRGLNAVVGTSLLRLIEKRWPMNGVYPLTEQDDLYTGHPLGDRLYGPGLFGFPLPSFGDGTQPGSPASNPDGVALLRSYFPSASVVILRPGPTKDRLGLALKGGVNDGGHTHRDNGTYVAVCNGEDLIVDPGMEAYTAKSFGPARFESMMMNSYGHDVPYVGRVLQNGGPEAQGLIVSTEFTESRDTIVMDLTSCYTVATKKRITRTFVFDRSKPLIEIIDEADFGQPTEFGTALVTVWSWQEQGPGHFVIYNERAALQAVVTAESSDVSNRVEKISGFNPNPRVQPERLGVNLTAPATHVRMRTVLTPITVPKGEDR